MAVATTIFYLTISQMSIPPWIVALLILVLVAGVGASRLGVNYGLPEGYLNNPLSSRRIIAPPLGVPNANPGNEYMQPYGLHDRSTHRGPVRNSGDPVFNYNPYREGFQEAKQKLYPGLDQNITTAQQPVPYSGVLSEETNSPLAQQLEVIKAVAKGTIPSDQNLAMISGGSGEGANVPLTQGYQPHQERIYPDQHPRPQYSQLTAGAPTDAGTIAEQIQKASVRTPSVREMVREEERRESESFSNTYAVRYQAI